MTAVVVRVRRALATVQGRITLGATTLVLVALVVAAIGLDVLLAATARDAFDRALVSRVDDRVALLAAGAAPTTLADTLGEEEFVVVYDASGVVLAAAGLVDPAAYVAPPAGSVVDQEVTVRGVEDDGTVEIELETLRVAVADGSAGTVVVGSETEQLDGPRRVERTALAIGVPLLALAAGLGAWRIVGAALRPVDALRRDVDRLAGTGGRVGVPPTDDEISDLAETMNGLLGRTEAHAAEQRRFIADASHELKSPVANLRAVVETSPGLAAHPDERATLVGETERLQRLVDDLLYLARTEPAAGPTEEPGVVDLEELVFDEAERLQRRHDRVTVEVAGVEPVRVAGRVGPLGRVVANLLDNAARHADGRVRLDLAVVDGRAVLRVGDDGDGIAPADRERVFDRFTRLDDARTRGAGGSGLGLAIVRRIVAEHGGAVTVGSSSLGGAELLVELPALDT